MSFELAFTPSGRLTVVECLGELADVARPAAGDGRLDPLLKSFASSQAEGLFGLATKRFDTPLPPALAYWRELAARYFTELCHTPSGAAGWEPIPPPPEPDLAAMLLSVPPMQGAEYLTVDSLASVWQDLDAWVGGRVAATGGKLPVFLKESAPLWHQVGRVCFHLAENRHDPDYPFAFLATYAPGLAGGSRIQYQPLSKALQQYAGAKDHKKLIGLLSPVHLAAKTSTLVKRMVDSGDIYQPLAWRPGDAYRFLKEVPVFEDSGVLVRLPDWWKKRPRPRVGVTIGDQRKKKDKGPGVLDFNVHLALGDEELSDAEWSDLLAAEDGLVLLRGQWVEVDRQKLSEALAHWKDLAAHADEGISFVEGMRLLAGAPARPGRRRTRATPNASGRSSTRANGWAKCWPTCAIPENLERAGPSRDFHATLRGYQETGVKWLCFLSSLGLGACLADDMGLGKTIQVLALLAGLKNGRRRSRRSWSCRPRCWPIGRRRWPASPRDCGPASCIPRKLPKETLAAVGRQSPRGTATTSTWC